MNLLRSRYLSTFEHFNIISCKQKDLLTLTMNIECYAYIYLNQQGKVATTKLNSINKITKLQTESTSQA